MFTICDRKRNAFIMRSKNTNKNNVPTFDKIVKSLEGELFNCPLSLDAIWVSWDPSVN